MMKKKMLWMTAVILICSLNCTLTSCDKEDNPVTPDDPNLCMQADYLVAGDKVALISPSYFTPMENVEKTAEVLRGWGLEPVVGPNVGKVVDGKYRFVILTRAANETMIEIHERMPVIVAEHEVRPYLTDPAAAERIIATAAPMLSRQSWA